MPGTRVEVNKIKAYSLKKIPLQSACAVALLHGKLVTLLKCSERKTSET